jgi:hypothetical protein
MERRGEERREGELLSKDIRVWILFMIGTYNKLSLVIKLNQVPSY